jgi:Icc-related predicted phosphoesterase
MRMLLVSDLHYELPHFDWLLSQAPGFDVVVLAGDHIDVASPVPLESQIVVVRTYLRKLAELTTTVACSGNHDLTTANDHGEKNANWLLADGCGDAIVDWGRIDRGGVRITVCPWWDGPATRTDVDGQLAADAVDRPSTWVWIYHYPPDRLPVSRVGSRHIGDADLNVWIDNYAPDLVLTGHIHNAPFAEGGSWITLSGQTWVLDAGRSPGAMPAHAIIDLAEGEAEWASALGRAEQTLWVDPVPGERPAESPRPLP